MKKILSFLFIVTLSIAGIAQNKKKALFVIVDGIPADVIEKLNTPALDVIAGNNGYARAHVGGEKGGYSETPTISAVGYNSLLTGTWVNKHNVWDNDIAAPNYHYYTLFRFFNEQYPKKKTAIFSSWQDNRTKLVGETMAATGFIKIDYHFDGLELDTTNFPHDAERNFMHRIDEAVTGAAVDYIKKEGPYLSWVYLEFTDDMGHRYGNSPEFFKSVALMDKQMGKLWSAIQYRKKQFGEDWVIYITTDHGRTADNGKGHGGQSDRERNTWIVTNAKELNNYFKSGKAGIVDIMPSIAKHLDITIPHESLMEIDGIPLTGKISATLANAKLENGKLHITWKAIEKKGNAKIWLCTSNHFKEGGKDNYLLVATVPLAKENTEIDVTSFPSSFYKIVIETPKNLLNRWVVVSKK